MAKLKLGTLVKNQKEMGDLLVIIKLTFINPPTIFRLRKSSKKQKQIMYMYIQAFIRMRI